MVSVIQYKDLSCSPIFPDIPYFLPLVSQSNFNPGFVYYTCAKALEHCLLQN